MANAPIDRTFIQLRRTNLCHIRASRDAHDHGDRRGSRYWRSAWSSTISLGGDLTIQPARMLIRADLAFEASGYHPDYNQQPATSSLFLSAQYGAAISAAAFRPLSAARQS